ncbi:TonB-dependent receptor family protein [Aestuariibaculum sediminum]|uniref:TonB-dependent receptor n=1 Tax=Aestuariibaculum sediminum TaxID=2770637 RepID=A0A8J6QAR6_9FLAO|nr:TonB-dependent receptor [Aestuariibaculum sediminum]MBD0832221.1 TonB-dependent receptor [Aestuariibaculum sediminum]
MGQSVGVIKVIDGDSGSPIYDAEIKHVNSNDKLYTNHQGFVELQKFGHYHIIKSGYIEQVFNIQKNTTIVQIFANPSELNEVVINANQISKPYKSNYAATQIITSKDIKRGNTIEFASVLNRSPGIFMQSGALNTNRIIIRGIGSRNLYGTSKIRAYFGDIPLTTGNGETTIEDFELGTMARMEIIKGSGSSIHGAGLGGTINLIPKSALLNETRIENQFTIGSFGLFKDLINLNFGTSKTSFNTTYSYTSSQGYRQNNKYKRQSLTLNINHYFNKKNDITILGSFSDVLGYIPSSINEDTFNNYPTQAAQNWLDAKGYEDTNRGILGLSWNHQYSEKLTHKTSLYTTALKAFEPRPFNILSEEAIAIGIRSRFLGNYKNFNWTLGGEFFNDFYTWKTFENNYQDFPEGYGSVKGNLQSNYKEKRYYYNFFFEANVNITQQTELAFGLNFNETSYHLIDRFHAGSENNQSGRYSFKPIWSPTFGITHKLSKNSNLFANVSHGFSPPTTTETLLPSGLINQQIKPETGWNYEIGTRTILLNNKLNGEISVYRMAISNLLVARRTGNDEYIGVNAGKTTHDGLELQINFKAVNSESLNVSVFSNYSLNHYKFKEFIDGNNNFSGNDLTGVPDEVINLGIDINSHHGIYGNINFQHVGQIPMNDDNSLFTKSYNLVNCKLGWLKNLNKKLNIDVYLGINNIFDKAYASQILINATGFNGSQPRYYYPGYPINFYSGFNLNYKIN